LTEVLTERTRFKRSSTRTYKFVNHQM